MRIIKNGRFIKIGFILSAFTAMTFQSFGTVIDFDSQGLTGPSTFAAANPIPQTIPITVSGITVTFNFGVILTQATNFPANQTSVYGTASFVPGMSNPMVITFSQPVTNFFMNLYNGLTTDERITYRTTMEIPKISLCRQILAVANPWLVLLQRAR